MKSNREMREYGAMWIQGPSFKIRDEKDAIGYFLDNATERKTKRMQNTQIP